MHRRFVKLRGFAGVLFAVGACGEQQAPGVEPGAVAVDAARPSAPVPDAGGAPQEAAVEGGSSPAVSASSPTWCAARAVLAEHCVGCHSLPTRAGAPMPLTSHADLMAPAHSNPSEPVFAHVAARIHDAADPMPPSGMLDDASLSTLDAWLEADADVRAIADDCAGEGTPTPSDEPLPWPDDCEAFYILRAHDPEDPSKPFRIPAGVEIQQGVPLEKPWGDTPVQVLMFRPRTDNAKIVHHWVLTGGEVGALDGEWLWGWAPGAGASLTLPDDVGMFLPDGPINLDMHYYNVEGTEDEYDASGVELCVTTKFRPFTATMGTDFNAFPQDIPAQRSSDHEDVCRIVLTTDEPIHVTALGPHMHKLGAHMFVSVTRDGEEKVLLDRPYAFTDQRIIPLPEEELLRDGDLVRTRCTYNNYTNRSVAYGPSSDDEMCVAFALHWPKDGYFCLPL